MSKEAVMKARIQWATDFYRWPIGSVNPQVCCWAAYALLPARLEPVSARSPCRLPSTRVISFVEMRLRPQQDRPIGARLAARQVRAILRDTPGLRLLH